MSIVLHAAVRQVWALNDSMCWALGGHMPQVASAGSEGEWLRPQGFALADDQITSATISSAVDRRFSELVGMSLEQLEHRVPLSDSSLREIGTRRSGAGWYRVENFIITSAFVRCLGALEQFELDTLKVLFYYRPKGQSGDPSEYEMRVVEPFVVLEAPEKRKDKEYFKFPVLWTWIKRHAENNVERSRILSNTFDIKAIPEHASGKERECYYEKRNAIAHGRADVSMQLDELVQAQAHVVNSMRFIAQQCEDRFKLIV